MATKSFEELNTGALTIKNNELPESNTHTLVGNQLVDMVAKEQEIDGKVNDLATGEGSNIDILKFNPETVAQLEQIGQVRYNPATQCLEVQLNDEVTLSVGLENYMRGKNADSIDLESPMVVFVSGGLGANALLTRASNDAVSGEKVIGVITQGIAKNNIGFVTTSGIVNNINTSAYAEGDVLWLGTNGTLTNVKPDVSVNQICIGVVLRSHATEGSLLVAIKDDWRGQVAQLRSDLSETITALEQELNGKVEDFIKIQDGKLIISDLYGFVIAEFSINGLSVTDISLLYKNELRDVVSIIKEQISTDLSILNMYDDKFYITDMYGFVFFAIEKNEEGLYILNYAGKEEDLPKHLVGYELFSIGDSLSSGGTWQKKVAELTGCTFRQEVNVKAGQNLSTGGTRMIGGDLYSGFFRAKNLVDQGVIKDGGKRAIIILENVNDFSSPISGQISDEPMSPKAPYESDFDLSNSEFTSDFLQSIPIDKRELNACVTGYVNSNYGKRLIITSLPTTDGNVTIGTGNMGTSWQYYTITVSKDDSMQTIVNKILEYDYTGVTDIDGGDGESVIFCHSPSSAPFLSFEDTGNTGMVCEITENVSAKIKSTRFFVGQNLTEWSDTLKWTDGTYLNHYRAWKSIIQYLQMNFPYALLIVGGFPLHSVSQSDYILANGMYNTKSWYDSDRESKGRELEEFHKEISSFFNIPYLDIVGECGITLSNISEFYPDNNVHPMTSGYNRFGEYIADKIIKFINK